jgi:hypothetical protein
MTGETLGAGLHQETLPDFILIRTDEVDEGERLRPVDPVWAKALGQMMARDGQDTPVQVCRLPGRNRWTLVAGAHRLAGAREVGIEHLRAEVVSADRDARRLREVRENLWRSDLMPIDRAAFIAEAVAIYKRRAGIDPERDGRVASVAARWQKQVADEAADTNDTMSRVYGWSDTVGEQIGLNKRTIERDLMLYRRLPASIVERLRSARHPVLSNASQLRALAKLEPVQQVAVVATLCGKLVNGRTITSVAQAVAQGSDAKKPLNLKDKRFRSVLDVLSRMDAGELAALFQSPQFHDLAPAEARVLLAPMRRDPNINQETADAAETMPAHGHRDAAGVARHGPAVRTSGLDAVSSSRDRVREGEDQRLDAAAVAGGSGVLAGDAAAPLSADLADNDLLRSATGFIAEQLGQDGDPDWIINELVRRHGGQARFQNGTYELKLGKIAATCTAGGIGLLRAWMTKAWVRLNEAKAAAA